MKIVDEIKYIIRHLLGLLFIFSGIVNFARKNVIKNMYITSIYFHNPGKLLFEKCITWLLKNNYRFISTGDLYEAIRNKKNVPPGAAVITIDDGYKNNIDNIIPIIKKYNIPATFFISTDPVENGIFWVSDTLNKNELALLNIKKKNNFNKMPESEKRTRIGLIKNKTKRGRNAMTVDDIINISRTSGVSIGSHTVHHSITINCSDSELDFEIGESKKKLENWTGRKISCFSYPNGLFDGREKPYLRKYDFKMAFTTEAEFIDVNDDIDLFLLPRFCVNDEGSLAENICKMVGVWQKFIK